jgi:hypothetical protein
MEIYASFTLSRNPRFDFLFADGQWVWDIAGPGRACNR